MKHIYVIDAKGEKEPFSFKKVYRSAKRVGASNSLAKEIARTIEKEAFDGIKTSEIFKRVRDLLYQKEPQPALKFSLKKAMRNLGPTGFPFERFVGEIFSKQGYRVKLNKTIPGFCCRYEIDFLAEKDNLLYIAECKYRNLPEGKIALDVALLNYARFLDIKKGNLFGKKNIKSLIVTNAKFTTETIKYSRCVGVDLLGWGSPKNKGLEYFIDSQKLYPVTILPSFKRFWSNIFIEEGMMLVEDLLKIDVERFSKRTKIPVNQLNSVIKEARILLD